MATIDEIKFQNPDFQNIAPSIGASIPGANIPNVSIDADIIGNTPLPRIPPVPPIPQTITIPGITASLGAGKDGIIPLPEPIVTDVAPSATTPPIKTITETVQELLGLKKAPPSIAEAFVDIFGQPITAAELKQKEQRVMSLTNQLNAITAQSTADILALDKKITGAGITDVRSSFLDKQKVEISRNAAIQALPLAAELSAAQDDFSTAQGHLNSYFNLVVQDAQAQTKFFNDAVDLAINLFSKAEQNRLTTIKAEKTANTNAMKDAVNNNQAIATVALRNGDTATFKALTSIPTPDPSSPTFKSDLDAYNEQVASFGSLITPPPTTTGTKPMSINQIEQFRRSYGWTPPFGFTQDQLLQFMQDNPNLTPEQYTIEANKVAQGDVAEQSTETPETVISFVLENISSSQLKALKKRADTAGISKILRGKKGDVEAYLESIKDAIQTALDGGTTKERLLEILTE